ncbi:hypothetical protein MKW92_028698 [Papaver armeniacum]|nr:hypothetical protein MKW92_028698 [Papaver armeniacum]
MFSSPATFGTQQPSIFGQNNSIFAPKPFGIPPTTPFGTQAAGSMFGGTSTGNFGGGFSSPAFGNPASAPVSSVPSFVTPTFSPAFGNANTPGFGTPTTPAFGIPTTPGFGTQPTAPAFGTPTTPCLSTPSPFGTQSSSFSFQTTPPSTVGTPGAFGQPVFGQQKRGGSRAVAYAPTELEDSSLGIGKVKVYSIPFMPVYAEKSHEELRWEDYQLGDKGGLKWATPQPNPSGIIQPNPFNSTPTNPNPFGLKTAGFPSSTPSNPFATGTSLTSTNVFNQPSTPAFTPFNFGTTSSTTPSTAPSPFNSTPGTTNTFGLTIGFYSSPFAPVSTTSAPLTSTVGTQNSGVWNGIFNSTPGTTNTFGLTIGVPPAFQQTNNALGQFYSSPFAPVSTTSAPLTSTVGTQNSGVWNGIFNSTPGTTNTFGLTIGVPPAFQQTNNALGQFSSSPFAPVSTTSTPLTSTVGTQHSGFWNSSLNSTPGTTNTFGLTIGVPPAFQQTNNALGQFSSSPFAPVSTTSTPLTSTVGTQHSGFWNSSLNSTPGTTNTFGLTIGVPPAFQQTNNALGQFSSSPFAPVSTTSSWAPLTNMVGTQNSGFMNNPFNSTQSQPSWKSPFGGQTNPSQQAQPAFTFPNNYQQQGQTTNPSPQPQPAFTFPYNFQQQQPAVSTGFGVQSSGFNNVPNSFSQPSVVAMNPFGTLPAMPQISIGHTRAAPSIQSGISKMPVVDKAAPVRVSPSLMTSRHLSQRRIRLPARSSCPNDCARVPFFSDDVEAPSTPKADALFIPRENPRVFVICPLEYWTSRTSSEQSKDTNNTPLHENGKLSGKVSGSSLNGPINHEKHMSIPLLAENVHAKERTDIETLMPKLRYPDYYTEPQIQELAAKERAEPGFCGRVKDFTVGRHGFGSIKFAGETDVRNLDLESLVQFNNREVIVYLDDSKKPPVGQGLNKAAVVTLLNIKCIDKKTGQQYLEGVKVEKYKELLIKKTHDQGAEFVSYDPIKGEWKFRVNHF